MLRNLGYHENSFSILQGIYNGSSTDKHYGIVILPG